MTPLPESRSTLERWLALVVRYWAYNMSLIHARGSDWPGFGYTDKEKAEMRSIAESYSAGEYYWWVAVLVVVAITLFLLVVLAGMNLLIKVIGGRQNMPNTPAALFFLSLALECVVSLSICLPAAMLPSAALVGRLYGVKNSDLPDRRTTAHYFHKLWFQITRMAIVMTLVVLPLWLFVPDDSKFMVIVRLVAPLLAPVISGLTTAYYFSARLQRSDQNTKRSAS